MSTPRRDEGGLATIFETAEPAPSPPAPPSRVQRHTKRRRKPGPISRVIGVLGELLITAGLLLGLFVVWQVYWTDVEAGATQRAAIEELSERSNSLPVEPPSAEDAVRAGEGDPPITSAPAAGEVFAALHVPRWGEDAIPVAEGVGMDLLDDGYAGRYPETQLPGEVGNFAVGAHRQSHGAAFRHVDSLESGDRMVVWTEEAWLVYEVTESYIVQPHEVEVLAPVPREPGVEATGRTITLTTCHPLFTTAERYIVHGEMTEWYPPSRTMPEHLKEVS